MRSLESVFTNTWTNYAISYLCNSISNDLKRVCNLPPVEGTLVSPSAATCGALFTAKASAPIRPKRWTISAIDARSRKPIGVAGSML
jgi:hypothetical protein